MEQQSTKQSSFEGTGYLDAPNTTGKSFNRLAYVEAKRFLSLAEHSAELSDTNKANAYIKNFTALSGIHAGEIKENGWIFSSKKKNISLIRSLSQDYNITTLNRYREEATKRGDDFTAEQYMQLYNAANYASVNEEASLEASELLDSTLAKITRSDSLEGVSDMAIAKLNSIRVKHLSGGNTMEDEIRRNSKTLDSNKWIFSASTTAKDTVGGVLVNATGLLDLAGDLYAFISGSPNPIQATERLVNAMDINTNSWSYTIGRAAGFVGQSPVISATRALSMAPKGVSGIGRAMSVLKSYGNKVKMGYAFIQAGIAHVLSTAAASMTKTAIDKTNIITNESRKESLPNLVGFSSVLGLHWLTSKDNRLVYKGEGGERPKAIYGSPKGGGDGSGGPEFSISEEIAIRNKNMYGEPESHSPNIPEKSSIGQISAESTGVNPVMLDAMDSVIETSNMLTELQKKNAIEAGSGEFAGEEYVYSIEDEISNSQIQSKIDKARLTDGQNFQGAIVIDGEIKNINESNVFSGARNPAKYNRSILKDGSLQVLNTDLETDITSLERIGVTLAETPSTEREIAILKDLSIHKGDIHGLEKEIVEAVNLSRQVIPTKVAARLAERGGWLNADNYRLGADMVRYEDPALSEKLERAADMSEVAMGFESKRNTDEGLLARDLMEKVDNARSNVVLELAGIDKNQIDLSKISDPDYIEQVTEDGIDHAEEILKDYFDRKYKNMDKSIDNGFANDRTFFTITQKALIKTLENFDKATKADLNKVVDYQFSVQRNKIAKNEGIPVQSVTEYLIAEIENNDSPHGFSRKMREVLRKIRVVKPSKSIQESAQRRTGSIYNYQHEILDPFSEIVRDTSKNALESVGENPSIIDEIQGEYKGFAEPRSELGLDKYSTKDTTVFKRLMDKPALFKKLLAPISGTEVKPDSPLAKLYQLMLAKALEPIIDVGIYKDISLVKGKNLLKELLKKRNVIQSLVGDEAFVDLAEAVNLVNKSMMRESIIQSIDDAESAKEAISKVNKSITEQASVTKDSLNAMRKTFKSFKAYFTPFKMVFAAISSAKFLESAMSSIESILEGRQATRLAQGTIALEASNQWKGVNTKYMAENLAKNNGYLNISKPVSSGK